MVFDIKVDMLIYLSSVMEPEVLKKRNLFQFQCYVSRSFRDAASKERILIVL